MRPSRLVTVACALNDESDHIRIIAAWTLLKLGEAEKCYATIGEIIEKETPALICSQCCDWMGEEGDPWRLRH